MVAHAWRFRESGVFTCQVFRQTGEPPLCTRGAAISGDSMAQTAGERAGNNLIKDFRTKNGSRLIQHMALTVVCVPRSLDGGLADREDQNGRGTARAEDAQGTPIQSHISPSILVYEDECIL